MQDEYVGDIGDYFKYALLRVIAGDAAQPMALGVNWYLTNRGEVDPLGERAGLKVGYLDSARVWRSLDPDVYDCLLRVTKGADGTVKSVTEGRSVAAVQRQAFWPTGTTYFARRLSWGETPDSEWKERREIRRKWHREALTALAASEVVFLDPDNAIRARGLFGKKGPKYASPEEVWGYLRRGQLVLLYAHASRTDTAETLVQRVDSLVRAGEHEDAASVATVLFHERNGRAFYLVGSGGRVNSVCPRLKDWVAKRRPEWGEWEVCEFH